MFNPTLKNAQEAQPLHAIEWITTRLYGREQEIGCLLESYDRISAGYGEIILVHGASGVGKTSLVNDLREPVRNNNGFFITGKFSQYQQNVPYDAFKQALVELCHELLKSEPSLRQRIRNDILQAVGNQGQLLIELAPEFVLLLGEQPSLDIVSPQEARHRFAEVLRNFFSTVCRPEHPVILFIDDWQWADRASVELLRQLQIGSSLKYLIVVASYRDNDIAPDHPFLSTVFDLRAHRVPVTSLMVPELTSQHVREIILDTFKPAVESIDKLARLVYDKTGGNPYFVNSFLHFLYDQNLIRHDDDQNCWRWHFIQSAEALPGDIVDLFALKLNNLDTDLRTLLSLAACLGNRFDIESLSIISGLETQRCHTLINSFAAGDFVQRQINNTTTYVFVHDRLQQAAYKLIKQEERNQVLLKIGRLLLRSLTADQISEKLFEITNNFNAGSDLISETDERMKILALNLQAAQKAFAATAYSAALSYYRAATCFLQDQEFEQYFTINFRVMAIDLFKNLAESEFLEGNQSKAETYIQRAVNLSETALEKSDVLCILIVQYTLLARYREAIAAGRKALENLGVNLPDDDYETARDQEIRLIREVLNNRPVASLKDLQVMSDLEQLMVGKILITLGPPCYRSHQRLWGVIVPKVVNLTIRFGTIPQIGYSFPAFGGLLCWVDDNYATACEFGKLATVLMTETFTGSTDQSVFYLMIGSSIRHWSQHLRHGSQDYQDAYEIGQRSGNLQYAAYAFGHNMYCQFYQGIHIPQLIDESQHSLEFSKLRLNRWASDLLEGGLQIFGQLSAAASDAEDTFSWSEQKYRSQLEEHHNHQVLTIYLVLKAFSLMVMGDEQEALQLSDEAEPLIYTVGTQGLLPWAEHVVARILIITSLYSKVDQARQVFWRSELDRMIGRLGIWAESCPDNFRHKHLLVQAEMARIKGRTQDAIYLYDEAIESAQTGGFLQWSAIANERASRFFSGSGNETLANSYWQQAYANYLRWGATAKADAMEAEGIASIVRGVSSVDEATRKIFLKKELSQLRTFASKVQQDVIQNSFVTQAKELARATQQLRVEIAERKRTEATLRESEEVYRRQFEDNAAIMLLVSPEDEAIVAANVSAVGFYGYEREKFLTMHITDIHVMPREDIQGAISTVSFGQSSRFESQHRLADGRVKDVEIFTSLIQFGKRPLLHSIIIDITERRNAEREIHRLNEILSESQKIAHVGSWEINLATKELYWSDETYRIHETTPTEYSPTIESAMDFYAPEMIPIINAAVKAAVDEGKEFQLELDLITAKGRPIKVYATSKIIKGNGVTSKIIGVFQDITERSKMAEQIQQTQKINSIGLLAGGVAHDFNNSLAVIMGHVELALMKADPENHCVENLKEIHTAAKRSADLTRKLLTFARKQTISPEVLDLNETVTGMLKMLQRLIGENIHLIWNPKPNLWAVKVDSTQLDQILTNLCVNARDAIAGIGKISITSENCSITASNQNADFEVQPGDYVHLSVSDDGHGIDKENLNQIFEPFFTTKEFGQGTGLGLSTVHGAIKQNNGFIEVVSEPGQGTTFHIYLPRQQIHKKTVKEAAAKPLRQGTETVLLVEDDQMLLNLAKTVLEQSGYTVLDALTIDRAISLAKEHSSPIHLLLSDLVMPEMNGKDLRDILQVIRPDMKVIFMSGYTADIVAKQGVIEEGINFLQKPVSFGVLTDKVREVLDGR